MFSLDEIKDLIHLLDETSIQELEIENEGSRICIRKPKLPEAGAGQLPVQQMMAYPAPGLPIQNTYGGNISGMENPPSMEEDASVHKIISPMVGTFYQAPSPDSPAYVKAGDKVKENAVVCIIEAMKLMNEIEAEVNGEIVEVLVDNGQLVEFGQPLFLVKKD